VERLVEAEPRCQSSNFDDSNVRDEICSPSVDRGHRTSTPAGDYHPSFVPAQALPNMGSSSVGVRRPVSFVGKLVDCGSA
jgi:hypothetical protein